MKTLSRFEHEQLVGWTAKFCRLFSIDEARVRATFIGTTAQLRVALDELLVLANQCGVNMETAIWNKYPNTCPYCLAKPCCCGPQKAAPHKRLNVPLPQGGLTLGDLQRMLGEIYPNHSSLLREIVDVISEVGEFSWAIWSLADPREIEEEFADVFARLIRIANKVDVVLEGLIA